MHTGLKEATGLALWYVTYEIKGYEFHIPPNSIINNINIDLE